MWLKIYFRSFMFWFVGWPAIGGLDPGPHGFRCKHDHSRLLFHPGAVHTTSVPRTHRQSGAREALSSCHPKAFSTMDGKAGNWGETTSVYIRRKLATHIIGFILRRAHSRDRDMTSQAIVWFSLWWVGFLGPGGFKGVPTKSRLHGFCP